MNVQRAIREKDARAATCWRSIGPLGGSNGTTLACLASGCMAWVLIDQIGIGPRGELRTTDLDGRTTWEWRGRCGLVEPVTPVEKVRQKIATDNQ